MDITIQDHVRRIIITTADKNVEIYVKDSIKNIRNIFKKSLYKNLYKLLLIFRVNSYFIIHHPLLHL